MYDKKSFGQNSGLRIADAVVALLFLPYGGFPSGGLVCEGCIVGLDGCRCFGVLLKLSGEGVSHLLFNPPCRTEKLPANIADLLPAPVLR